MHNKDRSRPRIAAWKRFLPRAGMAFVLAGFGGSMACSPQGNQSSPGEAGMIKEEPATRTDLPSLKRAADSVLADPDGVRAAKSAGRVFDAARALLAANDPTGAEVYFQRGLQLSPWRLADQLTYAEVLTQLGRPAEAAEIARMVDGRAESDDLCNHARKLLSRAPVPKATSSQPLPSVGPFVYMVQVGQVNQIALKASAEKLHQSLGVPVLVMERTVLPGTAQRSSFERWVRETLARQINWDIPQMKNLLKELHPGKPADLTAEQTLNVVREALKRSRQTASLEAIEEEASFFREHDLQWDAVKMMETLTSSHNLTDSSRGVIIGITEADLYSETSNYVFGMAKTGGRVGVVSYARYRADFFGEPPDLARLTSRMHKQLLSTVGNALGVPRPTDPTSARSYPASLPEHDAKSEYMSESCIAGFEAAWGIKLPLISHKPAGMR